VVRTQARIKSVYRSRGVLVSGVDVYGVWCQNPNDAYAARA
jgi:hypothetical protein